jgi:lysyl-tRNA synthetase class II
MGKAAFLDLRDGSGQIRVSARLDRLGDDGFETLRTWTSATSLASKALSSAPRPAGSPSTPNTDHAREALQTPPEKWHGLATSSSATVALP